MAVDFPNNPAVDELFFAQGTTWKWTGAAWAVVGSEGTPVEIVEADMAAKWQVWGDVLIQWGFAQSDAAGNGTIAAPQSFKSAEVAHWTVTAVSTLLFSAQIVSGTGTANSAAFATARIDTQVGGGCQAYWIAIGEAPDALKKPKIVQTIGGSELQEYHDPAGLASWRIVGTTLECWGFVNTSATDYVDAVFPKTFKNAPTVLLTYITPAENAIIPQLADRSTTKAIIGARLLSNALIATAVFWRAIGEWDGVS